MEERTEGLAESGLAWYKELKRFLTSEEGGSLIPSEADPCLFSTATIALHICCYVDDLVALSSNAKALDKFVATVSKQWDI